MPYITHTARARLGAINRPQNAGELNYVITRQLHCYIELAGLSYQHLNEVIGVLECAKHEFQRRVVDPYEDMKREQNGDVT